MPENDYTKNGDARTAQDLDIAREMCKAGVPVYLSEFGPDGSPRKPGWPTLGVDHRRVSQWQPGRQGLNARTGIAFDVFDHDPAKFGDEEAIRELAQALRPCVIGVTETARGGWHGYVPPLGLGTHIGLLPGVDLLGLEKPMNVFIPPTFGRPTKPGPYSWLVPLDLGRRDNYTVHLAVEELKKFTKALIAGKNGHAASTGTGSSWTDPDIDALLLSGIPPGQSHDDTLRDVAFKLVLRGLGDGAIGYLWSAIIAKTPTNPDWRYSPDDLARHVTGAREKVKNPVTLTAQQAGWAAAQGSAGFACGHARYDVRCPDCREASEAAARVVIERTSLLEPITDATFTDLLSRPPVPVIVKGMIEEDSLVTFFGDKGTYKSFAVIDLLCVAGCPGLLSWLGVSVVQHGACAYFPGEGRGGIPQRVQAWAAAHPELEPDLHVPEFDGIDLLLDAHVERVITYLRETRPRWLLVAFDAKADFMTSGDEDSNRDTSRLKAALLRIMKEGHVVTTIVIAHPGNREQHRVRGASRLGQAFDTLLRFRPGIITNRPEDGGKQRNLPPAPDIKFHARPAGGSLVVAPGLDLAQMSGQYGVSEDERDGAVIDAIRSAAPRRLSTEECARIVEDIGKERPGWSARTLRRRIDDLVAGHLLRRDPAGLLGLPADDLVNGNGNGNDGSVGP